MNALRSASLLGGVWLCLGSLTVFFINDYQSLVLGTVAITAIVGVGLNVLMGLAGQTSLGHAAFYAIGAYAATLLTTKLGVPYFIALIGAAFISGVAGALLALPALRAKGPYLAMITIAFGYFVEQGIAEWKDLTGGWNGIMNIPRPMLGGIEISGVQLTWFAILMSALLIPAYAWLAQSRWGIIMRATRDAEIAASALGAKLLVVRVIAFSISAALAGVAGSLFASMNGFISPESFPFFQSIIFLLMLMIGGVGYAAGPLLGALVVILLPELLSMLAEYRLIFFGGLLLIVLLIAPNGIAGTLATFWQKVFAPLIKQSNPRDLDKTSTHDPIASAETSIGFKQTPTALLTIRDLGVLFGGNHALKDVSLTALGGKITSLIGPNGAGKTTLINLVTGFYQATHGTVSLNEQKLSGLSSAQIGRSGLTRTYQTSQLFGSLSVLDNVYVGLLQGRLWGNIPVAARYDFCEKLLRFVGYLGTLEESARALAHVDRRLVEIARVLAARPAFVLLDEPAAGLSAEEKIQLASVLKNIAGSGVGVFIIEHDMTLVMSISDQIHVLDSGKLIASGAPTEIQQSAVVKAAYLGSGESTFLNQIATETPAQERAHDVLVVGRLAANYGAANVLTDIEFAVRQGETVAVLGANGAGKSTLMRVLSGLHPQFSGAIGFDGRDISALAAHQVARLGLVMVPEGRQVFSELSVEDNIRIGAHARVTLTNEKLQKIYAMFPKLLTLKTRRAGLLSGGEQQMLAIARGLAAEPLMLLLDEPSLGLAPAIVEDLFLRLAELKARGLTILLVDQRADLALALSDHANLLASGHMVFSGTSDALRDSGKLTEAYLGH
jgi:ABC-type branched-subunit amino acid transport system ATPase component